MIAYICNLPRSIGRLQLQLYFLPLDDREYEGRIKYMTPKRAEIQKYLIKYFQKIEASGKNAVKLQTMFDTMTDKDFDQWMQDLKNHEDMLQLEVPPLVTKIRMDDLLAVAKELAIPIFTRLKLWDEPTQSYYLTPKKYAVLSLPIRRMAQFVDHKLAVPDSDSKIDHLTGQVMKPDHANSLSQIEVQSLYARGLKSTILELIKYRGGDVSAFAEYKRELEEQGQTTIAKDTGSINRAAVVLDVYFSGMHILSNAAGGVL